jgi:cytochrome bd-type quinol oxidase subunit 2
MSSTEGHTPPPASRRKWSNVALLGATVLYVAVLALSWLLRAGHRAESWRGAFMQLASILGFVIGYLSIRRILERRAIATGPWISLLIWLAAGAIGGVAAWPLALDASERILSLETTVPYAFFLGLWFSQRRRPRPAASAS